MMWSRILTALFLVMVFGISLALYAAPPALPATPKRPVTDTYHGVKVTDDYRWLEKVNDPEVQKWIEAQNKVTRAALDASASLEPLRKRLKDLLTASSVRFSNLQIQGGVLFAMKTEPPKEQPLLVTLESASNPESAKVVLDLNQLDKKGKTAIDFYVPSHDGKRVAVCLSENGTEDGTVFVYEAAGGKRLEDVIPRVNFPTAGGSVAWNADNSGLYYTRYPRGSERPKEDMNFYQQIYFHKLGTPTEKDIYVLGKDFPRIAEIVLDTSSDGKQLLAVVEKGDGGEYEHFLQGSSAFKQISHYDDQISKAAFGVGEDSSLYVLSRKDAPRGKIMRLSLKNPNLAEAQTIVKESDVSIASFEPTANGLYVVDAVGGPSQMRFFNRDGSQEEKVPLPPVSSVNQVVHVRGDQVLFHAMTYIDPPAWYTLDKGGKAPQKTALFVKSPADFSDCEVLRDYATSKDGTKVPINIIRRKGTKLDGKNPTLLTGYGGFSISLSPTFSVGRRVWLDQGGVMAIANLRGGSEYGEEWHKAGNLTKKQNVFDDFAACAQFLIDQKYTSPDKLAIEGGSNGGLLMGAEITQHPDLFRAVVAHVGLYDMLRFEQHPNGVFNVTEYGSVTDADQFKALYAYSPYQHVKDGTRYPAVFLLAGINDGRVDPAQTLKMTARLQAATSSKRPVLLKVDFGSGHGIGDNLTAAIDRGADVYTFLFEQLGMKYQDGQSH
ncbi:MAG: prolyl oligopeptidase family serine peptidase [Gemmataceae bacterium]